MTKLRHLSFFQNIKKRLAENRLIKFLSFMEDNPRHRTMEKLNPLALTCLSILCFLGGVGAFVVWAYFTFIGFLVYYAGLIFVLMETLHFAFDR